MAGKSWADLLANPTWGNFGWAILDTAALLPLLPSSAYFRQGGKVLLDADEVAKFAKTVNGKTAVEAAMKAFKYSDGITEKAIKAINKKFKGTEAAKVLKLFQDAANKGLVGKVGTSGIKAITPTKVIGTQYTHEIKISSMGIIEFLAIKQKQEHGFLICSERDCIKMNLPIDPQGFSNFIRNNNLFEKADENLNECLKNFYTTDQANFREIFHTDLDKVMETYSFENTGVSFSKSFSYEPPLDYISVWIRIYDTEGDYLAEYTAFFDLELKCFDDKLK